MTMHEITTTHRVSEAQLRAAYRLASGRGHLWAGLSWPVPGKDIDVDGDAFGDHLTEDEAIAIQAGDPAERRRVLDAHRTAGGIGGIEGPSCVGSAIVHAGRSSRVNWRITESWRGSDHASVALEVTRPILDADGRRLGSGTAMTVTLDSWSADAPGRLGMTVGPLEVCQRHVDAVWTDLISLGLTWETHGDEFGRALTEVGIEVLPDEPAAPAEAPIVDESAMVVEHADCPARGPLEAQS